MSAATANYFSLSRNLRAGQQRALDAKVVIRPTFAIEGELGRERRSETILVSHCDGELALYQTITILEQNCKKLGLQINKAKSAILILRDTQKQKFGWI